MSGSFFHLRSRVFWPAFGYGLVVSLESKLITALETCKIEGVLFGSFEYLSRNDAKEYFFGLKASDRFETLCKGGP